MSGQLPKEVSKHQGGEEDPECHSRAAPGAGAAPRRSREGFSGEEAPAEERAPRETGRAEGGSPPQHSHPRIPGPPGRGGRARAEKTKAAGPPAARRGAPEEPPVNSARRELWRTVGGGSEPGLRLSAPAPLTCLEPPVLPEPSFRSCSSPTFTPWHLPSQPSFPSANSRPRASFPSP